MSTKVNKEEKKKALKEFRKRWDIDQPKEQKGQDQITSTYPLPRNQTSSDGTNTAQDSVNRSLTADMVKKHLTEKNAIPVVIKNKEFKLEPKHWIHNKNTSVIEANVPCGKIIFNLTLKNGILNEVDVSAINLKLKSATLDPLTQVYQASMRIRVIYVNGKVQDSSSIVSIKASDMEYFYKEFGKGDIKYTDRSKYKKWECYHMTDDNGNPLPRDTCDVCKCKR